MSSVNQKLGASSVLFGTLTRMGERIGLSAIGRRTGPNQIKALVAPFVGVPDVAMLAQGAPPSSVFPIRSIALELADGQTVTIDAPAAVTGASYLYATSGHVPLLKWCDRFFRKHHAPPGEVQVALHAGSTDAISTLAAVLLDPGDVCLCEAYTWGTALDGMRSRGLTLEGIAVDADGLLPAALEAACARLRADSRPPKALYIVPNGSNPCGSTLSAERFAAIYAICARYRVAIIEDDPYWFLSLAPSARLPGPACSSFAALDTDSLVVRIDSFAKAIAPGFRLGWLAGPPHVVRAFNGVCSTSTHNGSPFAMVVLHALLAHWGEAGFDAHVAAVRAEYARRLAVTLRAADAHLKGLAAWTAPKAGMFLWLDLAPSRVRDASALMPALREHRVLTIPSVVFSPAGATSAHMRISFSVATDGELGEGIARLARVLGEHKAASPAG